ncbi:hypothetical protein [Streptomyces sp. NPDC057238]|uniref:hypothetical protein n=1 Tax=Streptomyces sp. NPDC057238 TaxID=3346060 RepID=UPI00362AA392
MTWSAAVPGAALRAMRTAAGWRAVRLALLVGAVFVLGVLCGERARAADGGPVEGTSSAVGASTIGSVTVGSVVPTGSDTAPDSNGPASVIEALTVPRPDVADPILPLTETVVRSVDERVVRPVGELVGTVTGRLDEATPGQLPALPALPTLPALPMLPGLEQPAPLPELPHLPDAPERPLPEPSTPDPQPDTSTPPPDAPVQDAPDEPKGPDRPSGTPGPVAGPVAHGPEPARAVGATHDDHGHRPARDAVQEAVRGPGAPPRPPHRTLPALPPVSRTVRRAAARPWTTARRGTVTPAPSPRITGRRSGPYPTPPSAPR